MMHRLNILVSWLVLSLTVLSGPAVHAAAPDTSAKRQIGVAEKVVGDVYGNDILRRLKTGEDIYRDNRIRAGADGAADLRFLDRSRLTVGPKSEIVLDRFVYDPAANANQGTVKLVRGVLRFTSAALDRDVKFETPSAVIGIRGTTIDIMVTGQSTEVVVHEGRVQVTGPHGSIFVGAGETLTLTDKGPKRAKRGSPKVQRAVSDMLALVGNKPDTGQPLQTASQPQNVSSNDPISMGQRQHSHEQLGTPSTQPPAAPGDDIATLAAVAIRGKDLQNLLYLDLPYGRVIIEMRNDLAPRHIARIKELVRGKFYDGLKFHSVVPGRFAMTGDPTGTGRGGSGRNLASEFSSEAFRRGSVGMAHDRGKPESADSQFFVSLEEFPDINGQYTLWGQVIHGMHFIDQLRTGNPPSKPDVILRMRIAADATG